MSGKNLIPPNNNIKPTILATTKEAALSLEQIAYMTESAEITANPKHRIAADSEQLKFPYLNSK